MSDYRHVIVCHDCNTKSIFDINIEPKICSICGSDNFDEYIEQDKKGEGLHKFLDGEVSFVRQ